MFTKVRLRILYIFLLLTTYSINSNTHEFWIEPSQYQSKDSLITAHLRVGQEFQGMALMYNPKDFKSFKILSGTKNKKDKVIQIKFKAENSKFSLTIILFKPKIETAPNVGIDNKKDIFAESNLSKVSNLAAVIVIPDLLTPGIKDRI